VLKAYAAIIYTLSVCINAQQMLADVLITMLSGREARRSGTHDKDA
jgi:hypothetical protein